MIIWPQDVVSSPHLCPDWAAEAQQAQDTQPQSAPHRQIVSEVRLCSATRGQISSELVYPSIHWRLFTSLQTERIYSLARGNSRFVQVGACCRSCRGKAGFLFTQGWTSDWAPPETEGGSLRVGVRRWRADGGRRSQRRGHAQKLEMLSHWKGSKCLLFCLPSSARSITVQEHLREKYRLPPWLNHRLTWPHTETHATRRPGASF